MKHQPKNDLETWALGTVYKLVHQGVNICISNATIIDYYQSSTGVVKDYHSLLKTSGQQEFKSLPQPPEVRLNAHNINDLYENLYEVKHLLFL